MAAVTSASRSAMKSLVQRFYSDLWNKFDTSIADTIISPQVAFRGTMEHKTQDREGFKRYVREIQAGFPDFQARIDAVYVDGENCVARLLWTGTHNGEFRGVKATGRKFEYPGVGIFRIEQGLIKDVWAVGDTHAMWSVILK